MKGVLSMFEWLTTMNVYLVYTLLPAAFLLAVGILVIRFGTKLVKGILTKSKLESIAVNLILKVAQTVAYILLGLMVASKVGIDVSGIVALASVLTLAVSLSVQDLLLKYISSFTADEKQNLILNFKTSYQKRTFVHF